MASYCSDFFFFLLFFFSAFFSPSVESATTDAWLGLKEIALEDEVAAKSKIEPVSTAKRMRLMIFSKYFVFVKGSFAYAKVFEKLAKKCDRFNKFMIL